MEQQLIKAIVSGNLQRVQELLAAGANPNARRGKKTAFQLVPHGADEIKCALIEAGAEDPSLIHSLVWVTMTGRVETVRVLIEKGADVNVSTYSGTPIQVAARSGYTTIAKLLIAAGADVDARSRISTSLFDAIKYGHFDIALELIAAGADPNRTPTYGGVPAMAIAAVQGSAEVIRALLAAGAEVDVSVSQIAINRVTIEQKAIAGLKAGFTALEAVGEAMSALDAQSKEELPAAEVTKAMSALSKAEESSAELKSTEPDNAIDTTPAILAACCGHAEALTVLLAAGADPYRKDGEGLSAYDWAVRNEQAQVLEVLNRFGVKESKVSPNEYLLNAAEQGDVAAVSQWLAAGAQANARDRRRKTKNSTPLILAVAGGPRGIGIGENPISKDSGLNPFLSGHLEVVQVLLQAGADPNLSDAGEEPVSIPQRLIDGTAPETIIKMGYCLGRTPLMLAAKNGNIQIVRALIEKNVDLNARDLLGFNALFLACKSGHFDVVRELVNAGVSVNQPDFGRNTPLLVALGNGHITLAKYLVDLGADVNAKDPGDETVLMKAAALGEVEFVKLLLDPGLDVNFRSRGGFTALVHAATGNHLATVEVLLQAGADPNMLNCWETPLASAAKKSNLKMLQVLLDAGAKVETPAADGDTAYDLAEIYKQQEALELLRQYAIEWPPQKKQREEAPEEERWGAELPQPNFFLSDQNAEFQQAVADLAEICGSKPVLLSDTPGWFQVHVHSKRRPKINTENLQRQFLERGCFVYEPDYSHGEKPEKLCILPTTDKYNVIALHQTNGCNYGIGPGYVVEWLKKLEVEQPFVLTCIAHDTLAGHFLTQIEDPEGLAFRMYDFCPDIVDQGCGSIEVLAQSLQASSELFFWWD